ncbi:hypothetical protein SAMD00019534_095190 [Acytostelium subglobosum LB1]|uniref:hypothetical protein n=1 Tax=Acytostelium subglobosum LB1 TaxID=1410327 RepID=UPI000644C26A|nr:hypothetical protein SAMD00019534_095190 [Acytostelium subglobosum LB1]GAM26344.1 hypothetical protein SAMD00019534_095190 [Acytostelium subglobosum LB1]|eukprot:XP_012750898.1 hypothetical protein SAMD00019534_095190 [Acytostelium subglobosum LB1]
MIDDERVDTGMSFQHHTDHNNHFQSITKSHPQSSTSELFPLETKPISSSSITGSSAKTLPSLSLNLSNINNINSNGNKSLGQFTLPSPTPSPKHLPSLPIVLSDLKTIGQTSAATTPTSTTMSTISTTTPAQHATTQPVKIIPSATVLPTQSSAPTMSLPPPTSTTGDKTIKTQLDKPKRPKTEKVSSSSSTRVCEFCKCNTTPTWRRGPSGKGSLCNACGIKWRLKGKDSLVKKPKLDLLGAKQGVNPLGQKIHSQQSSFPSMKSATKILPSSSSSSSANFNFPLHSLSSNNNNSSTISHFPSKPSPTAPFTSSSYYPSGAPSINRLHQEQKQFQQQQLQHSMQHLHQQQMFHQQLPSMSRSSSSSELSVPCRSPELQAPLKKRTLTLTEFADNALLPFDSDKGYFCKYCKKTWPQSSFKNSQQFGAHCSNCSRKPRGEIEALMSLKKLTKSGRVLEDDGAVPLWDTNSNSSSSSSQNPLLVRLLSIVENQLLEPEELSSIKEEINGLKSDMLEKKKRRIDQLESNKNNINKELNEMRAKINEYITSNEHTKRDYIDTIKKEYDDRVHDSDTQFGESPSHTVPATKHHLTPTTKLPMSPEIIDSPTNKRPKYYVDGQGTRHHIDMRDIPTTTLE